MNLELEMGKMRLRCAINGMLQAIADAANPAYPEWSPYRGNVTNISVFYVKFVMRRCRALGLLESYERQEAEAA